MGVRRFGIALALAAAAVLPGCAAETEATVQQQVAARKGGDGRTGEYDVVEGWWKDADNHDERWGWGQVSGLAVDNPNRIIVVTRGDWPRTRRSQPGQGPGSQGELRRGNWLVVADGNGNIVENWTQWDSLFNLPHQVYINPYDPERAIWVTESGGPSAHQVYKFSNDGKQLLLRLGTLDSPKTQEEARADTDPDDFQFGWPSTLAFLPNGNVLLADGYWNSRIVEFTQEGEFVQDFGSLGVQEPGGPPAPPGTFNLMHGTAVDRAGRIYQGDRRNSRVQIFSPTGEFIDQWTDIQDPVNVYIDENEAVWVTSAALNRIMRYNTNGELQYFFGTYGTFQGGLMRPHQFDVDENGTLYIANYDGGYVSKFVPKPDADPSKLIGQKLVLPAATN
jgi:DNA-binding beta-propeller fold protein YncE